MTPDALSLFNPAGQQHGWTPWLRKSSPTALWFGYYGDSA